MEAKLEERKRAEARRPGFIKRWSMNQGSSFDSALGASGKRDDVPSPRHSRLYRASRGDTVDVASKRQMLHRQVGSGTRATPDSDFEEIDRGGPTRRVSPKVLSRENSSQTTEELLHFLMPQLRRRLVRTDAQQDSLESDDHVLESRSSTSYSRVLCDYSPRQSQLSGVKSIRGPMGFLDLGYENELYESPDDDDDDDVSGEEPSNISPLLDQVSVWSNSSFGADIAEDFDPTNCRYNYQPDLNPILEMSSTTLHQRGDAPSGNERGNRRLTGDWSTDTACTTVDGSTEGLKPTKSEDDLLGCLLDISPYSLPPSRSVPDLPNVNVHVQRPDLKTLNDDDSDSIQNGIAMSSGLLSPPHASAARKNSYDKFQMALRARGIFVNIDQVQSSDV